MIKKEEVTQIVEDFLQKDPLYFLVDVKVTQDNRIGVEIDSFQGISIDYCIELNKFIESKLDRDVEDYELEVSSAGLTSPFKVRKQYEKNIGNEVEIFTYDNKKLSGVLNALDEEKIFLEIEKQEKPEGAKRKITVKEEITIPFTNIKTTKYIIRFK